MFFALLPQDLLAISLPASPRPHPPASSSWLGSICSVSPSLRSRTQVPVSCLRSYCQPFQTLSQGKAFPSCGSHLWFSLLLFLYSPPSISISFHLSLCAPLLFSYWPVFPERTLPSFCSLSLLPPLHSPIFSFPFPLLSCPFSPPHTSEHLLSIPHSVIFLSYKGSWLIRTASPYTGPMTQFLWVTVSFSPESKAEREALAWSLLQHASLSQPAPLPWQRRRTRSGPRGTWVPLCLKAGPK